MEQALELHEGSQLADRSWRLNNLYTIQDKAGKKIPFRLNWAQTALLDGLHECNLILKARQLGFTTFVQLFMLDACLFNSNIRAGTIAHRLDDARVIFRDKVKFPYDHLPDQLKAARPIVRDSADELEFANNSSDPRLDLDAIRHAAISARLRSTDSSARASPRRRERSEPAR